MSTEDAGYVSRLRLRRGDATTGEMLAAVATRWGLVTLEDYALFALCHSLASEVEVSGPDPEPLSVRLRLRQFRGPVVNAAEREALSEAMTEHIAIGTRVIVEAMTT